MHLVFLIHGLFGNSGHLKAIEKSILEAIPSHDNNIELHRAQSMSAVGTFDGIENNAYKLLDELLSCIAKTRPTHLSIIGYSMGGLCGRYLIGLLEEAGTFQKIQPVVFATFATPHLGSQYPKKGLYGVLFNFIGSRIIGLSGNDLFARSDILNKLAEPESPFVRGLAQFPHLYLFANVRNDRTVPFWTAYISPKDPFENKQSVDLKLFDEVFVDMQNSKYGVKKPKKPVSFTVKWRRRLLNLLIHGLLPFFLVFLICVMSAISVISFIKQKMSVSFTKNPGKDFVAKIGSALENALDMGAGPSNEQSDDNNQSGIDDDDDIETHSSKTTSSLSTTHRNTRDVGIASPGYTGLIAGTQPSLDLSPKMMKTIESLNSLHWQKYAVKLPTINTHGEIVDRRNGSKRGKQLLNHFAEIFVEIHRGLKQPGITSNGSQTQLRMESAKRATDKGGQLPSRI